MAKDKKVIGFTSVTGDFLHSGHIVMLEECKQKCDELIVGFITDPSDRGKVQFESVYQKFCRLDNLKTVDKVIPIQNEEDLDLFLRMNVFRIDIRFVGEEYESKNFTGKDFCLLNNIDIQYVHRRHSLSSTGIRTKIKEAQDE